MPVQDLWFLQWCCWRFDSSGCGTVSFSQ